MSESVIACEGYYDRAFWAGWLDHFGCVDPGERPNGRRVPVRDPWGESVSAGQFAFRAPSGKFIRVVPCQGKDKVIPFAESRLKDRKDKTLPRLVLNVDSDAYVGGLVGNNTALTQQAVEGLLQRLGEPVRYENDEFVLDGGATRLSVIRWQADDSHGDGLPRQQTLERLLCCALIAAYPHRAASVQAWLDSRREAPEAGPKEFAWSQMAGWHAEFGCETFCRKVWLDPRVAEELKARLTRSGAWRIAETLAE